MVSGQNDRNNVWRHADKNGVEDLPQWCPAKMTGITRKADTDPLDEDLPQWCPAKMTGITTKEHVRAAWSYMPQWCPAKMTGITTITERTRPDA